MKYRQSAPAPFIEGSIFQHQHQSDFTDRQVINSAIGVEAQFNMNSMFWKDDPDYAEKF